jgi:hypothetical protein
MENVNIPSEERKTEFRNRKRRQHIFSSFMGIIAIILFLFDRIDRLKQYSFITDEISYLILGLVIIYFAFTLWNWRCPICGKHFGRRWDPIYCFGCDTRFDEDAA